MSSEKDTKIKNVMRLVHQKGVVTAVYLRRLGVSYQSMLKYRQSDWLRSLGNGAFCESGDVPSIDAALAALVEQLGLPIHLGGKTALSQRGIMQYVPIGGMPFERNGFPARMPVNSSAGALVFSPTKRALNVARRRARSHRRNARSWNLRRKCRRRSRLGSCTS